MYKFLPFGLCLVLAALVLVGCEGAAMPAGAQAGQQALDPFSDDANARATLEMAQAQKKGTQSAQAERILEITADAAEAAQAIAMSQATSQAESTSTAQAMAQAQATGTAQAEVTAQALGFQATSQALAFQSTQTVSAMSAQATSQAQAIASAQLALEREKYNNKIKALYGYILIALIVGVVLGTLSYIAIQFVRVRHFHRDPLGGAGYMVIDGKTLLLPELAPEAVTILDQPAQVDQARADYIKAGAQRIEAIRAANANARPIAPIDPSALFGPGVTEPVEVVDPGSIKIILDEVEQKYLDNPD